MVKRKIISAVVAMMLFSIMGGSATVSAAALVETDDSFRGQPVGLDYTFIAPVDLGSNTYSGSIGDVDLNRDRTDHLRFNLPAGTTITAGFYQTTGGPRGISFWSDYAGQPNTEVYQGDTYNFSAAELAAINSCGFLDVEPFDFQGGVEGNKNTYTIGLTVSYFDPPKGRIVLLADDWTLGNYFSYGDAYQFTSNVFMWLTEYTDSSIKPKILVDKNYRYGSGHSIEPLLSALTSLGYDWDDVYPANWTPEMLAGYGAVLLERGQFTGLYDSTIVKDYIVDGGGALVVGGATPQNIEDQNKILNWFGLKVNSHVTVGYQELTDFVPHPVTQDVSMLATLNPTPITLVPGWRQLLQPQILAQKLEYNWLAVWDGFVNVNIDIKPGSDPNSINLDGNGVIPVAILGSASFDATTVNSFTVKLANAEVRLKGKSGTVGSLEDVNGDGYADLVVQVYTDQLALEAGDGEAILVGYTYDGLPIRGKDWIKVVPTQ